MERDPLEDPGFNGVIILIVIFWLWEVGHELD
jgi:hypothetical protein